LYGFLAKKYGKEFVSDVPTKNMLRPNVTITLNSRFVNPNDMEETGIKEGDVISINPPLC